MSEIGFNPEPRILCARCDQELEEGECRACDQFDTDFGWLMKQPQFRRFFMGFTDRPHWCCAAGITFDLDHAQSAYLEGRRSVAVQLRNYAQEIAPKLFVRAVIEEVNARTPDQTPTTENAS